MRPLRRKLTTTFVALGLLALLVIGVTSYTVVQWRDTEDALSRHYTRSLRLQEVRALTFEAFKEVPDAVIGGDIDPREDFTPLLEARGRAFQEWASVVEDDAERAEVAAVRAAAQRLDANAIEIFDLVDAGRREEAVVQLEAVEEAAFEPFEALTAAAVQSDRDKRAVIRAAADDARRDAALTLVVAALGALSLLLLIGAYLSGGVFTPVRKLRDALRSLNDGDAGVRVAEDGDDEVAEVNHEFNVLAATLQQRGAPATGAPPPAVDDARLVLSRLVGGLREEAETLQTAVDGHRAETVVALMAKIDAFEATLGRMGGLAYPVNLQLAPVGPAVLLHEVLDRVSDEVVRRSISTDIGVDPGFGPLLVDRARLRETLGELVRNALDALPERGGRLRLRVCPADDGWISVEVEDNGPGISEEDVAWLYDGSDRPQDPRGVGLRLATSVVEQHGGRLQLQTLPAGGTIARILLPPGGHTTAAPTEQDNP